MPEEIDRKKEAREVAEALREFIKTLTTPDESYKIEFHNDALADLSKIYLQHHLLVRY